MLKCCQTVSVNCSSATALTQLLQVIWLVHHNYLPTFAGLAHGQWWELFYSFLASQLAMLFLGPEILKIHGPKTRHLSNTQAHTGSRAYNLIYILKTCDCLLEQRWGVIASWPANSNLTSDAWTWTWTCWQTWTATLPPDQLQVELLNKFMLYHVGFLSSETTE